MAWRTVVAVTSTCPVPLVRGRNRRGMNTIAISRAP